MKIFVSALLVAASFVSCSSTSAVEGDIEMTDANRFEPETFTVAAGETIMFANPSDQTHTVTAYDEDLPPGSTYFASGGFDSEDDARANLSGGLIDPGESYELTLEESGTYRYFCIPHESQGMTGTIVVEASG